MYTSPNMGLTVWNLATDLYDHNAQANNLVALDQHDHSNGKGVQIGSPGIANGAIISAKLATGAVGPTNVSGGVLSLVLRPAGGNITAVSGDWVLASPGVTITLPGATPNAHLVIQASRFATSASPVTVSGVNIYGSGLTGATAFKLGAAAAVVTLESDGTSWYIVSGAQDTGWVDLPLRLDDYPGIGTPTGGSYTASIRLHGDMVSFKGALHNGGGDITPPSIPFATLPAAYRPSQLVYPPVVSAQSVAQITWLAIATNGDMIIPGNAGTWAAGGVIGLDSLTYSLS